jgi:hypothetical protein
MVKVLAFFSALGSYGTNYKCTWLIREQFLSVLWDVFNCQIDDYLSWV